MFEIKHCHPPVQRG